MGESKQNPKDKTHKKEGTTESQWINRRNTI